MRKTIGIVIGCILLCGLAMAAMLAEAPSATVTVTINGKEDTQGVDTPWFELSKGKGETVSWTNATGKDCQVIYTGQSPFDTNPIKIDAGQTSEPKSATSAPDPPPGWKDKYPDKVYKFYKYTVSCQGVGVFDPGNGIKP
jgi:hypothetical protein